MQWKCSASLWAFYSLRPQCCCGQKFGSLDSLLDKALNWQGSADIVVLLDWGGWSGVGQIFLEERVVWWWLQGCAIQGCLFGELAYIREAQRSHNSWEDDVASLSLRTSESKNFSVWVWKFRNPGGLLVQVSESKVWRPCGSDIPGQQDTLAP